METITLNDIHRDLNQLKEMIFEIKASMNNEDSTLDEQDIVALSEYNKEKFEGNLFSQEALDKELEL
ncbi:hypothetical protein KAS08_04200 [Candidatus Pacearchaeota archaeon]|nr:hypothetical protein [Candidatus Pacearchaeota archaeon]